MSKETMKETIEFILQLPVNEHIRLSVTNNGHIEDTWGDSCGGTVDISNLKKLAEFFTSYCQPLSEWKCVSNEVDENHCGVSVSIVTELIKPLEEIKAEMAKQEDVQEKTETVGFTVTGRTPKSATIDVSAESE